MIGSVSIPKLRFKLLSNFNNLSDLLTCGIASMTIIPFFQSLTNYKGKYYLDGVLTGLYVVPPDCNYLEEDNKNNVIKVHCRYSKHCDISPNEDFK